MFRTYDDWKTTEPDQDLVCQGDDDGDIVRCDEGYSEAEIERSQDMIAALFAAAGVPLDDGEAR